MSAESLVKARAAQAEVRAREEITFLCPKGVPEHRIVLLIKPQAVWCSHGRMRPAPQ